MYKKSAGVLTAIEDFYDIYLKLDGNGYLKTALSQIELDKFERAANALDDLRKELERFYYID